MFESINSILSIKDSNSEYVIAKSPITEKHLTILSRSPLVKLQDKEK